MLSYLRLQKIVCRTDIYHIVPTAFNLFVFLCGEYCFFVSPNVLFLLPYSVITKIIFKSLFNSSVRLTQALVVCCLSYALSECRRSFAVSIFESLIEHTDIGKTVVKRNSCDRMLGIKQIVHCVVKPDARHIGKKAHTIVLLEKTRKIAFRKIKLSG